MAVDHSFGRGKVARRRLVRGVVATAVATATISTLSVQSLTAAPALAASNQTGDARILDVIGHRAGFEARPENTMSAIRHAISLGVDAVELDMVFTRDGAKAIFHDLTLDRTTTCTGAVDAKTWKQLRLCDAGVKFGRKFAGERIPSLDRALQKLRKSNLTVYIHVRDVKNTAQAKSILRAVKKNKMNNARTVIFAGKARILQRLDAVGAKPKNMGQLFSDASGWNSRYGTLVPYRTPITRNLVDRAHARGRRVVAVENYPLTPRTVDGLNLDGYMANDLGAAMKKWR